MHIEDLCISIVINFIRGGCIVAFFVCAVVYVCVYVCVCVCVCVCVSVCVCVCFIPSFYHNDCYLAVPIKYKVKTPEFF